MRNIKKLVDLSNIKRISFRQDINSLRAVAVLAVVFYHAGFESFKGGWLGVDIFFVISGYLISNIIISELNEGSFTFKNFYLRRVRRILPVFYFICLLLTLISIISFNYDELLEFIKSLVASLSFVSNFYFSNLDFYTYDPIKYSFLVHTWSLAVEEQFYLIFPLILFYINKKFKSKGFIILSTIASCSFALNILISNQDKFYFLEYRLWEFFAGCLVMIVAQNVLIKNLKVKLLGIALIIFPMFVFSDEWILDIEPKVIAIFGTILFLFDRNENKILNYVTNNRIISSIGLSSYSMYLLHQPLFAFSRIIKDSFNRGELQNLEKLFLILILFILSNVLYKKIEIIYINEKSLGKIFLYLSKNIVSIVLFIFFIILINNYYSKNNAYDYRSEPGGIGETNSISILGESNSTPKFVLVGDSHAHHYSKSLDELGKREGFSFFKFTRSNCLSLINYTNTYKFGLEGYELCVNLYNSALQKAEEYNIPIVYGNFWIYDIKNNSSDEISKWINREDPFNLIRDELTMSLSAYDIPDIYIIGKTIGSSNTPFSKPIKCANSNGKKIIKFLNLELDDKFKLCLSFNEQKNIEINELIFNSIEGYKNIVFINPAQIYCNSNGCVDFLNNKYVYYDSHLSYSGSKLLTNKILELLKLQK